MKRVPFEVAKYLKEVGYPQDKYECNEGYAISEVRYQVYSSRDATWYSESADPGSILSFDFDYYYPEGYGEYCVAPYYMDVWLWLWREKGIKIKYDLSYIISGVKAEPCKKWFDDPEEAIEAAIKFLVNNNLIK